MRPLRAVLTIAVALLVLAAVPVIVGQSLDPEARQWVERTLRSMTLEQKAGQVLFASADSTFTSTDSQTFDRLLHQVRDLHVGGLVLFGGPEPAPRVLFNQTYGAAVLGDPLAAASLLNRLQRVSEIPLMAAADFEWGVGMRIARATSIPRAMALGAAGDTALAFEAARIVGIESRAVGVHVNFGPVADVNNNPRNPVINTRSFGEDPTRVAAMVSAFARGLEAGGVLATLKHFPGHGDTDVDSHLGLPSSSADMARLEQLELVPFRSGLEAGAPGVMVAHIEMPALDPSPSTPATLSRPVITDLLRGILGFSGLVFTDSMRMDAIDKLQPRADAVVRALQAGSDVILDSPDLDAAYQGILDGVKRGTIDQRQLDASVRRVLEAKARLGLHRQRIVSLDDVVSNVGTREHAALARRLAQQSMTLVRDERHDVPLRLPTRAALLCINVLDYPTGWRIAPPGRTLVNELRQRYADVTAVELSDRSSPDEIDLVRTLASRMDAVVANVYVRASSGSGRMDLAPSLVNLLQDIARATTTKGTPFVTTFFGNPYVAAEMPELPAVLLTYDFSDLPEAAAVRALVGEAAIGGRLPVALPGLAPVGAGLDRPEGGAASLSR